MSTRRRPSTAVLVVLVLLLLVAGLFSAGQALTFAWLSAFPDRAAQLPALEARFWAFVSLAVVSLSIAVFLVTRLVRRLNDNYGGNARPDR
jgi:H+/Cl- antiporter ClcA